MANSISNYDGSITTSPQQLIYPESVEQIQAVLRDSSKYPGPVRPMGSYHSLTPCASSDGTILNMTRMNKVIRIDEGKRTFTAQGGMQFIDANHALRVRNLQFFTNVEIGNLTLGSAASCHTKDALDGIEFGQVGSYVSAMKWVTPSGDLAEASDDTSPDLMRKMRASHGLAGVIYQVTFRVKPIEALHLTYLPRPVEELTQAEVDKLMDSSEGLICWTVGRTAIFQQRTKVADPGIFGSLLAAARRKLWNHSGAHANQLIGKFLSDAGLRNKVQQGAFDFQNFLYSTLHAIGGITILAPDKTVDYSHTDASSKYAFTFWAFPRAQWVATLTAYLDFADTHFKATGFRCNLPLGAYHIRKDQNSLLSYTYDQEIFSLDPIHASTDDAAWHNFLQKFNDFAAQRNGIPLLNQSPFIERKHMEAAYGQRWADFSDWIRTVDPNERMLNPFLAGLLSQRPARASGSAA